MGNGADGGLRVSSCDFVDDGLCPHLMTLVHAGLHALHRVRYEYLHVTPVSASTHLTHRMNFFLSPFSLTIHLRIYIDPRATAIIPITQDSSHLMPFNLHFMDRAHSCPPLFDSYFVIYRVHLLDSQKDIQGIKVLVFEFIIYFSMFHVINLNPIYNSSIRLPQHSSTCGTPQT